MPSLLRLLVGCHVCLLFEAAPPAYRDEPMLHRRGRRLGSGDKTPFTQRLDHQEELPVVRRLVDLASPLASKDLR